MRLTNLTRRTEIGANSYLLEIAKRQVLLDAGMHPKAEGEEASPAFHLLPEALDAVVLSHAHQDHLGSLPLAVRKSPDTPVFMTEATLLLSDVMLHNSVNIMTRIREEKGYPNYPLFTHREVDRVVKRWQPRALRRPFTTDDSPVEAGAGLTFEFFDAGHILGSVGTLMRGEGRSVFYTGDVNLEDQTISRAADFPEEGVDVLIMETTRGDSPTAPGYTREKEAARLIEGINAAFERGGCAIIPLFALGKTQEILVLLNQMKRAGRMPGVPIYIGGLSAKLTEIHDRLADRTRRFHEGLQILDTVAPFVLAGKSLAQTAVKPRRIYAMSSGMMTEKTGSNTLARNILDQPEHSILFVGYSDPASPAGILRATPPGAEVALDGDHPPKALRCDVEAFTFSAHASRESLRAWVGRLKPKTVVLVHGDPPAVDWFKSALASDLPSTRVIVPPPGVTVEL